VVTDSDARPEDVEAIERMGPTVHVVDVPAS
jgi:hypothetical protein